MASRTNGAGGRLSGVLERSTPRDGSADLADQVEGEQAPAKGKAAAPKKGKMRGRTIYLDDVLFERILVQAHRRDRTISEYVSGILDRQVPDHRVKDEAPTARGEQEN